MVKGFESLLRIRIMTRNEYLVKDDKQGPFMSLPGGGGYVV